MHVHSNTPKVQSNLNSPKVAKTNIGDDLKTQEQKASAVKEASASVKSDHLGHNFDFKA
ncbi:MAG: hypothetical protein KC646_15130 [Candidatus Cloacimonetes bacterium]|nr:hypothetical protein [Candidatus Cloacimonadota bacterium]